MSIEQQPRAASADQVSRPGSRSGKPIGPSTPAADQSDADWQPRDPRESPISGPDWFREETLRLLLKIVGALAGIVLLGAFAALINKSITAVEALAILGATFSQLMAVLAAVASIYVVVQKHHQ